MLKQHGMWTQLTSIILWILIFYDMFIGFIEVGSIVLIFFSTQWKQDTSHGCIYLWYFQGEDWWYCFCTSNNWWIQGNVVILMCFTFSSRKIIWVPFLFHYWFLILSIWMQAREAALAAAHGKMVDFQRRKSKGMLCFKMQFLLLIIL